VEEQRVQRRLAAILAADVVGFSRLTGLDEEGTIARLRALRRELIDTTIACHRGRIVKTTGDGMLIEFASVVHAVSCAVELQREMASRNLDFPADRRIEFRVGINLGDVVIEGDDVLGDGVNVAARLEGLAEPGGICISEDAYRQVRDKMPLRFADGGEQQLKNISRPVRVYRLVREDAGRTPIVTAPDSSLLSEPPLPSMPSIAVLPFQNMSGDPEQEYFVDGIVEDIITALSRFPSLMVIARNSSFTYKGRAVDIKRAGRELGVHYILEGSVRKAANRMRITCQLAHAETGTHLWADHFDGVLKDVFTLQDDVTVKVVAAVQPKIDAAELQRSGRKSTQSLTAYDYFLRGLSLYHGTTLEANREALRHFYKAIELDPGYSSAYGLAAVCYNSRKSAVWFTDRSSEIAEGLRLARKAVEIGREDPVALNCAGSVLAFLGGEIEFGAALVDQALALNPNLAMSWFVSGFVRVSLSEPDKAIAHVARAERLSPRDPRLHWFASTVATAHLIAGRYADALLSSDRALAFQPGHLWAMRTKAAALGLLGRIDKATAVLAEVLALDPSFTLATLPDRTFPLRPKDMALLIEGLRKAGLPEG
jgi:TolB-like protein/class 3 adenylate cyclase